MAYKNTQNIMIENARLIFKTSLGRGVNLTVKVTKTSAWF